MNDLDNKSLMCKYQRSKFIVKQWEEQFKAENKKTPTKDDFKKASKKVRYHYRIYWQLKNKFMEETIFGDSSPMQSFCISRYKSDNVLKEHTNIMEDKCSFATKFNTVTTGKDEKENKSLQDGENLKTKPKTWGSHLNNIKASTFEINYNSPLNRTVSDKLFEGSKFKKRNPRKALKKINSNVSMVNGNDSSKSESSANDSAVSLNASQIQTNLSFNSIDTFSSFDSSMADFSPFTDTQTEVSSAEPYSVQNDCSPKIKALIMSKTELSPLFARCEKPRVISEKPTVQSHAISLVQHLTSEAKKINPPLRKLDVGWIDRCNDTVNRSDFKMSSDSGLESLDSSYLGIFVEGDSKEDMKSAVTMPSDGDCNNDGDDDDDDIIGCSDNELTDNSKLSFLPVKMKCDDSSLLNISPNTSLLAAPKFSQPSDKSANSPESRSDQETIQQPSKKIKLDPYSFPSKFPKVKKSAAEIKEARLEKKIKQGTLNENYVRIDLKKKVYVRGKKNFNFTNHKKKEWKNLKKNLDAEESSIIRCFKCGDVGHYSRYCQKVTDNLLDEYISEEESPLPTLEEAEALARENAKPKTKSILIPSISTVQPDPEETPVSVKPIYDLNEDQSVCETPPEVFEALNKFGHYRFRPGQEQAIMRILSGLSTLVTISTGGGKSLCYQLPAYLYASKTKCITLVISPLVSLMEDQVSGSTSFFKLGCLHTNQTQKQRQTVIDDAKKGKLLALLVSPEAIVSGDGPSGLCSTIKSLPPIAFACIDEVHCLSQWSHNFRPSYLMLAKVLKEKLGVKTILGLTATATKSTISSITQELGITDRTGVIKDLPLPSNLCLSVSRDQYKDEALLKLLQGPRFKDANAILIYCTRRDECERLAVLIRTIQQDPQQIRTSSSKRLSWNAESYHAGMSSARRKQVQKAFMKGNLRIVVATVAFGMGINKRDIRGVIHYNMPKDFESYVQEVGRAGRDGMLAHCHVFLDPEGKDLNELRRHIHANVVDRHVLRKLLQKVFIECKCKQMGKVCLGHEVAFNCKETVEMLDIPEENIFTLLCYLELNEKQFVKVLPPSYMHCRVQSYRGIKAIIAAAKHCSPLAVACAQNESTLKDGGSSSLAFDVIALANSISWDSGMVKRELKKAEWQQDKNEKWKKSGIIVDFTELGFRIVSRGDLTAEELDETLNYLIRRVESQEKRSSAQLEIIFSALTHFSAPNYEECLKDYDKEKSDRLKHVIRKYFETEELDDEIPARNLQVKEFDEEEIASDVRTLICSYRDNNFNGRAVARIFHGIQSPNYPASIWFKSRYWRHHMDKDFNKICKIATREILRFK